MNRKRRQAIAEVITQVNSAKTRLISIKIQEEIAYGCMPESLQYSARGMNSDEAIQNLDEAFDALQDAETALVRSMA